jgi:hypothetical protein
MKVLVVQNKNCHMQLVTVSHCKAPYKTVRRQHNCGMPSLRSNPSLFKHIHAVILRNDDFGDVFLFATVEAVPYLTPIAAGSDYGPTYCLKM